jgi:hypothetical protein
VTVCVVARPVKVFGVTASYVLAKAALAAAGSVAAMIAAALLRSQ